MPLEQAQALHDTRLADLRIQLSALTSVHPRVTLEIGCGHGHFLTAYAAAYPEKFCIGIDLIADRLQRAGRKTTRAGIANIAWIQAEAGLFLEALPANATLGEIFILFPDPWPKRRHWKNRVMQPAFLDTLAARAGEGTPLHFRTDHGPYFAHVHEFVSRHPAWTLTPETSWPFELVTVFQQRAETYQSLIAIRNSFGQLQDK